MILVARFLPTLCHKAAVYVRTLEYILTILVTKLGYEHKRKIPVSVLERIYN